MNEFVNQIKRIPNNELNLAISLYKKSFDIPEQYSNSFLPDLKQKDLKHSDTFGVYSSEKLIAATTIFPKGQLALVAQIGIDKDYRSNGIFRDIENFIVNNYETGEVKPSTIVWESPNPNQVEDLIGRKIGAKNILEAEYDYNVIEKVENRYFLNVNDKIHRLPGFILAKEVRNIPKLRSNKRNVKINLPDDISDIQKHIFSIHATSSFEFALGLNIEDLEFVDYKPSNEDMAVSVKYFGRNNSPYNNQIVSTVFSNDLGKNDIRYDLLDNPIFLINNNKIILNGPIIDEGFPKAPGKLSMFVLYDKTKPVETKDLVSLVGNLEREISNHDDIKSKVRYLSHMGGGHTIHVVPVKPKYLPKANNRLKNNSNKFDFIVEEDKIVFLGHDPEIRKDRVLQKFFYMEKLN